MTEPYSPKELMEMRAIERERIERNKEEKILREVIIDEIEPTPPDPGGEVLRIYEENRPGPIVFTGTEAVKDRFILRKSYRSNARDATFEMIVFKYNDWRRLKDEHDLASSDPSTRDRFFKSAGVRSEAEYKKFVQEQARLAEKGYQFSFPEILMSYARSAMSRKIRKVLRNDSGSITLDNPQHILNDNTTILYRIIGKDLLLLHNWKNYYNRLHDTPEPIFFITNLRGGDTGKWM